MVFLLYISCLEPSPNLWLMNFNIYIYKTISSKVSTPSAWELLLKFVAFENGHNLTIPFDSRRFINLR